MAVVDMGAFEWRELDECEYILHVDCTQSISGNGLTWETAFQRLQDAVDEAHGDPCIPLILVADGTYYASYEDDRDESFHLLNGVTIMGGFAGNGAGNPYARDTLNTPSILSGDLEQDDYEADLYSNKDDNSKTVLKGSDPDDDPVNETAILDGFIIQYGYGGADTGSHAAGAGIFNVPGSRPAFRDITVQYNHVPTATLFDGAGGGVYNSPVSGEGPSYHDCVIQTNMADQGGGMANADCNAIVVNTHFYSNSAFLGGGALHNVQTYGNESSPTLENCEIAGNAAWGGGFSYAGGGFLNEGGSPVLRNCRFDFNILSHAIFARGGGAGFASLGGSPKLAGCRFLENTFFTDELTFDIYGAGVYLDESSAEIVSCELYENTIYNYEYGPLLGTGGGMGIIYPGTVILTNCLFARNQAGIGGGLSVTGPGGSVDVTNCTFAENDALNGVGGGVMFEPVNTDPEHPEEWTYVTIRNSILWDNSQCPGGCDSSETAQIYEPDAPTERLSVSDCDVQGLTVYSGSSNFDLNPVFVFPDAQNFRLAPCSPCIDEGTVSFVPIDDLDVDQDGDFDELTPDLDRRMRVDALFSTVDTGAFEYRPCDGSLGDMNGDLSVDAQDAPLLAACLTDLYHLPLNPGCECADMDQNGLVQSADLQCFVLLVNGQPLCETTCGEDPGGLDLMDCDQNSTVDLIDILNQAVPDCNGNLIPDSCDVNPADPDGNGSSSRDGDEDGTPDECE